MWWVTIKECTFVTDKEKELIPHESEDQTGFKIVNYSHEGKLLSKLSFEVRRPKK